MFIDVEGIEGSGKTTLAERVTQKLKRLGYRVALASGPSHEGRVERRVRQLSRDPSLLQMTPEARFFLEAARTAQQLQEFIRPALGRGEICLTDRYVFHALADAWAHAVDQTDALEAAAQLACHGVWPDLVVLLDVDPELGRLRRELKLWTEGTPLPRSLQGEGFATFQREAMLELSRRDPHRWVVIDAGAQPIDVVTERIVEILLLRLQGAESEARATLPFTLAPALEVNDVEGRFFAEVDAAEKREGALALLLLEGVPGPAAQQRRLAWVQSRPDLVARSLRGLKDPDSFTLRELLASVVPTSVLYSLGADVSPRALRLRAQLIEKAPSDALVGLEGQDTPQAWWLREQALKLGAAEAVLESLAGLDSDRAWKLRAAHASGVSDSVLARSLRGVRSAKADELRKSIASQDLIAAVESTEGLSSPLARELRDALFTRAPGTVLSSLFGVDSEHSWELREKGAPRCPEALRSMRGVDREAAWSLRQRYLSRWPTAAVESLGELAGTARGQQLIDAVLLARPNAMTLKATFLASLGALRKLRPSQDEAPSELVLAS